MPLGGGISVCAILVTSYRPVQTSRTTNARMFMGSWAFAPAIVGMSGQIHADFLRLFWVLADKQMLSYFESKEDKIGNLRDVNGRNPCKLHRRAMPVSIFAALECVSQCKSFFLQFSLLRVLMQLVAKKSQAAAQIILGFFESLVSVSFGWAVGRRAKYITRTQNSLVHHESMTAMHMSSAVTNDEIYHTVCGSHFGSSVDLSLQQEGPMPAMSPIEMHEEPMVGTSDNISETNSSYASCLSSTYLLLLTNMCVRMKQALRRRHCPLQYYQIFPFFKLLLHTL